MADKNPSVNVPREVILQTAEATYKVAQNKPELLKFGISETYLTTFLADIEKAKSFKNDEALSNETKGATKEKNLQLELSYEWLQAAQFIYTGKFKKSDPQYKEFPEKISQYSKNEAEMIDLLPNIITLLNKYKTDLTDMQSNFIAEGELCLQNLNERDALQGAKMKEDTEYTAARHAAEYVVYYKVNKINEAGNLAYKKNPAVRKLFKSPWPKPPKGGKGEEPTPPPAS
ncbi:MAG: hypothetical protein Q8N83_03315 [Ignavibacteria bacterium]|nr:hypothetical protein [Ignavibacteria bacterium]